MISKIKDYLSYMLNIREILFILENINIKKKYKKKKEGTILIQLTLDHWYLLFYKSLIVSKYSDYNIYGLWTHIIWPEKEKESYFFYLTKLIVRKIVYLKWLLLYRSIGVTKFLNMGKKVYLIDMQDKDPSEMGFVNFTHHVQQAEEMDLGKLLRYKLS
jgi:hypothetical protein